jgi:hypothetical protein
MSETHRGPPPVDREPDDHWLEKFVLPYITNSALWPVLFAIIGHIAVLLAMPMVNVWRDHSIPSAAALGFLLFGPCGAVVRWEWRTNRKPGPLSWTLLITWAMSVGLAYLAARYGLY